MLWSKSGRRGVCSSLVHIPPNPNTDDFSSYLKNNSFVEHLLQEINRARVDTKLRGIKATHITSGNIGENNGGSYWMRLQPFCVHVFMNTLDDGAKH